MKSYPSIPHLSGLRRDRLPTKVWAFDKIDGSNIRIEWSLKRGFYKYCTRTQLLLPHDPIFGGIPDLFASTLASELDVIFRELRWKRVQVFMEYYGDGSFAGTHDRSTPKALHVLDVAHDNQGFLEPKEFWDIFGNRVRCAPLLYTGPLTEEFLDAVRDHQHPGVSFEGVVAKGAYQSPGRPWMAKIKTKTWYQALRDYCGDNKALFEKLK